MRRQHLPSCVFSASTSTAGTRQAALHLERDSRILSSSRRPTATLQRKGQRVVPNGLRCNWSGPAFWTATPPSLAAAQPYTVQRIYAPAAAAEQPHYNTQELLTSLPVHRHRVGGDFNCISGQ
ncbi:hypothetical protein COCSUDRAFT_59731 [Coccomyxa subellipsoidea C-169]|uniref:Endonuclease/exonuclease/phosphatase domain-containing protein n=1 Tax=Coccomyxa subellipsoidea (strain C-169) TaxID=574566 RepID=I0YLH1_COCSC|nr:hypothetical protein COCSUDRAFT_59731 [Coccomyxa subellipsoidea C-169]EIE19240.1 hypothetical protein COCSUDRAFT_59731 [Coccomyxa subellipsoidea C-169]|eukprot:XP_005643784.1 hypothetical protein COCSUDRAFT_59731 [Coccomyxa subellipsoidea C-169]